jgi:anaerobic selenocysteine-containing dehydrogenase
VTAEETQTPADGLHLLTYRLLYDDGSRIRRTKGIRELTSDSFAEINTADGERLAIGDGDRVVVSSRHGSITARAQVSNGIREGAVFVPWSQWGVTAQTLCAWDDRTPSIRVERA